MVWTNFYVLGFITPGAIFVLWTNFLVVAFIGSCAIFVVVRPNSAAPMGSPAEGVYRALKQGAAGRSYGG